MKKCSQAVLDIAAEIMPALKYLGERGIIGFWPVWNAGPSFQMHKDEFLAVFPDPAIVYIEDDEYGGSRRAVAYHNGVRFFALIDMEDDDV